jgi:hypothetical protein
MRFYEVISDKAVQYCGTMQDATTAAKSMAENTDQTVEVWKVEVGYGKSDIIALANGKEWRKSADKVAEHVGKLTKEEDSND